MDYSLSPAEEEAAYRKAVGKVEYDFKLLDVEHRKELGLPLKEEHFPDEKSYIAYLAEDDSIEPGVQNKQSMKRLSDNLAKLKVEEPPKRSALFQLLDAAEDVLSKALYPDNPKGSGVIKIPEPPPPPVPKPEPLAVRYEGGCQPKKKAGYRSDSLEPGDNISFDQAAIMAEILYTGSKEKQA